MQVDGKGRHFAWRKRLRFLEGIAKTAAEDLVGNHQLEAGKLPIFRKLLRIHVDQLDDPIAIGAGGGSEELGSDLAGEGDVFLEFAGLPGEHVVAAIDKALVL